MKNIVPPRIKSIAHRYGFLIISCVYLLTAFFILPSYGINYDSPKNFTEGRVNLNYLLTGKATIADQVLIIYQIHGSFFFMIAELSKRIFHDLLGWLDPISARHAILPVLVFLFLNVFFRTVQKRATSQAAVFACLVLLTLPHFWGYAFHNIKDIPLLIFFSCTIFAFYEWYETGYQKSRYLYAASLSWGFALLSKSTAVLVPAILFLWLVILVWRLRNKPDPFPSVHPPLKGFLSRKNLPHIFAGFGLVILMILIFYMPAFYSVDNKTAFWEVKMNIARSVGHESRKWSLIPWITIFHTLPVLTLLITFLGVVSSFLRKSPSPLTRLMLCWLLSVLLVACTPLFPVYGGIRLFIVFLVPFSFFTASGIICLGELLAKATKLQAKSASWLVGMICVAIQVGGIASTHPYETTFFNALAGGLKGAQEKNLPDASDVWLTSYREASRWLNQNASDGAHVWVPSPDGYAILSHYPSRGDLKRSFVTRCPLPKNSFLIMTPGDSCWIGVRKDLQRALWHEISGMVKIHEIKRQGGEILTIYHKP
ncbi:MAG: ArnT family glycosyltransferase [Candidatus Omnitrophota bacterium]